MTENIDTLLKSTQIRKPAIITDPENFLLQTPHLPFFLQPLSPAEKTCYQHKTLIFTPTPKLQQKRGFKWDKEINETQDGCIDTDGHFFLKPKKENFWFLKGSLVPYTLNDINNMKNNGELEGKQMKRVEDPFYVLYEEIERRGGKFDDHSMDEMFKALKNEGYMSNEITKDRNLQPGQMNKNLVKDVNKKDKIANKGRISGKETNVYKEKNVLKGQFAKQQATDMLLAMGCDTKLQDIEIMIGGKTRIEAILLLEKITNKGKMACVELLNVVINGGSVVLADEIDEEGFKPVKNINRRR